MEAKLDHLMKDQKVESQISVNDLFARAINSTEGGASQYNTELVKMMLEMIATGASPSEIESLVIIFAHTIDPDVNVESLPHLRYIQNLRVVLHTIGEAIGVIQLSEFDNWDQLFTDATSVQRLGIQGLIITAYDCSDGTTNKCALGGGGIVLEN